MPLKIVMLGPSGVGKTSLLAAMRDSFQQQNLPIVLWPTGETAEKLDKKWEQLINIQEGDIFEEAPAGMEQTINCFEHYEFELRVQGQRSGPKLEIIDIRGGMVNQQDQALADLVDSSTVVFHVVDSAAMLELQPIKAKVLNAVGPTLNLIKMRANASPLLIVSILTKCEKYLHQKQDHQLKKQFTEQFEGLISFIASNSHFNHKLVAVETLGCVHFSRIDRDAGRERFVFMKRGNTLKPSRLEAPLQLAISHAFRQAVDGKNVFRMLWDSITGQQRKEQKALEQFAETLNPKDVL